MNTRRQAQRSAKSCKSEGSISNTSPHSTISLAYQIESETSKGCTLDHMKTQAKYEQPQSQEGVIWEEDYNQLMDIYKQISAPSLPNHQVANAVFNQLTQFTASDLLLLSSAPLWAKIREDQIIQTFCQTIVSLSSPNFKCTLIEFGNQKFLAVEIGNEHEYKLLEAEPFALEFFHKRQLFLSQFQEKCSGQQGQKLSELSTEIIFLYHEYHKLRNHIVGKIQLKCAQNGNSELEYEENLKSLIRQLKILKRARKNK